MERYTREGEMVRPTVQRDAKMSAGRGRPTWVAQEEENEERDAHSTPRNHRPPNRTIQQSTRPDQQ
jgi:hypothetical protein